MSSLLVVESGSTKTDWCLLKKGSKLVHLKTAGINPYLQSEEEIRSMIHAELDWDPVKFSPDGIVYYGAGASAEEKQEEISRVLKDFFKKPKVEVQGDLMAAARGLCGDDKGIVCILGTGSNSCFYNGKKVKEQQVSLGYIAGDEGSGNHLGKRILQYYAYHTFDGELTEAFEAQFGNDVAKFLHRMYREPYPNRFLASFVPFLVQHRGHYMIENILEDCFNDFFQCHVLKYRESWKHPIHFTGSVAFHFSDVLEGICHQYELELGRIIQSPMDGLIAYHKQQL